MNLFDREIKELREYLQGKSLEQTIKEIHYTKSAVQWPSGEGRNIVLGEDVGVELGNPQEESLSFIVLTDSKNEVRDNKISLIGPDLQESQGKSLPFGKVVIVSGKGFDETNSYERFRDIESIRFDVDLKGYMLRAVSQYQREWSRVSKEALKKGFSFSILGSALIDKLKEKDYIDAVEIVFVTSRREDVAELRGISDRVTKIVNAMNKMIEEMSFDCDSCEYIDVCSEVEDLKKMRQAFQKST